MSNVLVGSVPFNEIKIFDNAKKNKNKYEDQLMDSPIAMNNAPTFVAVFADVSIWMMSLSAEYCCASSVWTFLLFSISALFPANAMTTWGSPLLWSSFTQDFAPLKESWIESRTVQLVDYNVTIVLILHCNLHAMKMWFYFPRIPALLAAQYRVRCTKLYITNQFTNMTYEQNKSIY